MTQVDDMVIDGIKCNINLHRKIITHGLYVRAVKPKEQVKEVLQRLDLHGAVQPFTRCTRCNGLLKAISKQTVDHRLEPKTRRYYNDFLQCEQCGQVYWQGSHHQRCGFRIRRWIDSAAKVSRKKNLTSS